MSDHLKFPKHGIPHSIDTTKPEVKECLKRIVLLHDNATITLMLLLLMRGKINVPCTQCIRDAALMFKDLGSAIDELMDMK